MSAESSDFQSQFGKVQELLACPACYGALRVDESRVICSVCGRAYPVVDGIPVLIAEQGQAE